MLTRTAIAAGTFGNFWLTIQNTADRQMRNLFFLLAVFISFPLLRYLLETVIPGHKAGVYAFHQLRLRSKNCCLLPSAVVPLRLKKKTPFDWEKKKNFCRRASISCASISCAHLSRFWAAAGKRPE
jgi:hypothetical protein